MNNPASLEHINNSGPFQILNVALMSEDLISVSGLFGEMVYERISESFSLTFIYLKMSREDTCFF